MKTGKENITMSQEVVIKIAQAICVIGSLITFAGAFIQLRHYNTSNKKGLIIIAIGFGIVTLGMVIRAIIC